MVKSDPEIQDNNDATTAASVDDGETSFEGSYDTDGNSMSVEDFHANLDKFLSNPHPSPAPQSTEPAPAQPEAETQPDGSSEIEEVAPVSEDDSFDYDDSVLAVTAKQGEAEPSPEVDPNAEATPDQVESDPETAPEAVSTETEPPEVPKLEDLDTSNQPGGKIRIDPKDEVETLALKTLKFQEPYKDYSVRQLLDLAERILNPDKITPDPAPQVKSDDADTPEGDDTPESESTDPWSGLDSNALEAKSDELYEQAESLEAEADELYSDMQLEEAKEKRAIARDIAKQARAAEKQIASAREREDAAWNEFNESYESSEQKVVADYPDAGVEGSHFHDKMVATSLQWQAKNDPRVTEPNFPELIAADVAARMGLQPVSQQQQPDPAPSPAVVEPKGGKTSPLHPPVPASKQASLQPRHKAAPAPAPGGASRGDRSGGLSEALKEIDFGDTESFQKLMAEQGYGGF